MNKKENAVAVKEGQFVSIPEEISTELMGAVSEHVTGFENVTASDVAIPFVKILQALSPEVKKGPDQVSGASEGELMNTVTGAIYKGPISVVCCAFQRAYVEWVPREKGGGFVQQHANSSILLKCTKNDKNKDMLPNGNNVVTTAYHFCLRIENGVVVEKLVLPFASSQLKKSRKWLSQMQAIRMALPNGHTITPPMFSHIYEVSTETETKDANSWSGYKISNPSPINSKPVFEEALALYKAFMDGSVKAADPVDEGTSESAENVSNIF